MFSFSVEASFRTRFDIPMFTCVSFYFFLMYTISSSDSESLRSCLLICVLWSTFSLFEKYCDWQLKLIIFLASTY